MAEICKAGVTTEGHCCWLFGVVCPFLRDDGKQRRFSRKRRYVCTFRERLGSWDAVHADPEYQDTIAPVMLAATGVLCGDWPRPGETCAECGGKG